ncbi:MAG TPA: N-acetylmuramoyl-L-alanine amidase [Fimbriiglobus sp.]|jgi:N-acetylmuramoyl-L-alanine amidase
MSKHFWLVAALGIQSSAGLAATPVQADPPLKGAVIVVDPGHGGQRYSKSYTGGTRGTASKLTESELNLRVAFELAKFLKANGAEVHMTREADQRLSREGSRNVDELHARIDFFEHYNCHFFLSVHHNAGGDSASGHTALWKHNAKDDTLYESLAKDVNDALDGAVPGPKNALIGKNGNYHILRETDIAGTISEAGFMTNRGFDDLCNRPEFPKKEAEAIGAGAIKYWTDHKAALIALRDKLAKARAANPRDPNTYTAIALNPKYRAEMSALLAKVAPGGKYSAAKAGEYVEAFRKEVVTDPKAKFTVKAAVSGKTIALTGEVSDRKYHDRLIDMFVAMKLFDLSNKIKVPTPPMKKVISIRA